MLGLGYGRLGFDTRQRQAKMIKTDFCHLYRLKVIFRHKAQSIFPLNPDTFIQFFLFCEILSQCIFQTPILFRATDTYNILTIWVYKHLPFVSFKHLIAYAYSQSNTVHSHTLEILISVS